MAYGMIVMSFGLYAAVVAISYVGKDYTRPHLPPIVSDAEDGDLGGFDDLSSTSSTSSSIHGGVHEEDGGDDHPSLGEVNAAVLGGGGGGEGGSGDGGRGGIAGVGGGEGVTTTTTTTAASTAGGKHHKRASDDAWKSAAAEVNKARAVNRLIGMDKVDHYLAKRREHKAAAASGGGGGGHKLRDTWVAGSRTAGDKDRTDTKFYDQYLKKMLEKKPPYPLLKGFLHRVIDLYPDSHTLWFDGGAGTCGTMDALLNAGKDVKGVEISDVRKTSCAGMYNAGRVVQGTLDKIPYPDDAFDVVFSSEVLEHVPPALAAASVRELVRITRGDIFVTISLRRSGLDPKRGPTKVHLTVRPREWWEKLFIDAGCEVNKANLRAFDEYDESRYGTRPNFFSFTCDKKKRGGGSGGGGGGGSGGALLGGGSGDPQHHHQLGESE